MTWKERFKQKCTLATNKQQTRTKLRKKEKLKQYEKNNTRKANTHKRRKERQPEERRLIEGAIRNE